MTPERRAEILSKDILSISDVSELTDKSYWMAADLIRTIKRMLNPLYQESGKIARNDYLRYFDTHRAIAEEVPKQISRQQTTKQTKREIPLLRVKDYIAK